MEPPERPETLPREAAVQRSWMRLMNSEMWGPTKRETAGSNQPTVNLRVAR